MDITKHGELDSPKNFETFVCDRCGCEFTANDGEYYVDSDVESNTIITAGYQVTVTDLYICSCPECHLIVKKERRRVLQNSTLLYHGKEIGVPEACKNCSTYPMNGGSGNCNCILGSMVQVT